MSEEQTHTDRERAYQWFHGENTHGHSLELEMQALAAEFAKVRAEATKAERERCARALNSRASELRGRGSSNSLDREVLWECADELDERATAILNGE